MPRRSSQDFLHTYVALIQFNPKKPGFFLKNRVSIDAHLVVNQPPNGFATPQMSCIGELNLASQRHH